MAWIESHQELAGHPKTKRLMRALGVDRFAAVGVLHLFWWWAMDWAEEGDLSSYSDEDLADAVAWPGDATAFVAALTTAGFINPDRTIHDWQTYIGRLLERRRADADRKRKARGQDAPSPGCPPDIRETAHVNRNPLPLPEPLPEKDDEETTTAVVVAVTAAPVAPVPKPSVQARQVLEHWRAAHGKRKPPKLNPTQLAALEEALVDLGTERMSEAVLWSAKHAVDEFIKCVNAAYTKRQHDENPPPVAYAARNGRDRHKQDYDLNSPEERALMKKMNVLTDDDLPAPPPPGDAEWTF